MNLITIEVFDDRYDFGFAVSAGGWCCNCWCYCSCCSCSSSNEIADQLIA